MEKGREQDHILFRCHSLHKKGKGQMKEGTISCPLFFYRVGFTLGDVKDFCRSSTSPAL